MNNPFLKKALKGMRLSGGEIVELFQLDLLSLGTTAREIKDSKHSHKRITYIIDRNINYSNICVSGCRFCAFYRRKDDPEAYTLAKEEIFQKIEELSSDHIACNNAQDIQCHQHQQNAKAWETESKDLMYQFYCVLIYGRIKYLNCKEGKRQGNDRKQAPDDIFF